MTIEQNKTVVRKFVDCINAKDLDTALTLLSPNFVDHTPLAGLPPGIEGVQMFFTMQFAAFPDGHSTVQDVIAKGDKVVCRMNDQGTHLGAFLGIAPTDKHIRWSSIDIWRVANGKLAEHWVEADMMGMMQQLGLLPPPPAR